MPALNFKKQFANKVKSNHKPGTIRAKRKIAIKPGDTLYLYTGMRTSSCTHLATRKCLAVIPIKIWTYRFSSKSQPYGQVLLDGYTLTEKNLEEFIRLDGFKNKNEFYSFFYNQTAFYGDWIVWKKGALKFWKNNPVNKKPAQEPPMMGMSY